MNPLSLLKRPSAFLPVAMSFGALATVLIFVAFHGTAPQGGLATCCAADKLCSGERGPASRLNDQPAA
jgi:hypothetical protein